MASPSGGSGGSEASLRAGMLSVLSPCCSPKASSLKHAGRGCRLITDSILKSRKRSSSFYMVRRAFIQTEHLGGTTDAYQAVSFGARCSTLTQRNC